MTANFLAVSGGMVLLALAGACSLLFFLILLVDYLIIRRKIFRRNRKGKTK